MTHGRPCARRRGLEHMAPIPKSGHAFGAGRVGWAVDGLDCPLMVLMGLWSFIEFHEKSFPNGHHCVNSNAI